MIHILLQRTDGEITALGQCPWCPWTTQQTATDPRALARTVAAQITQHLTSWHPEQLDVPAPVGVEWRLRIES